MEGRSQHKSQGEGRLELKGELFSGLNLKENAISGNAPEVSPFSGIDISIAGIPAITNNAEEPIKKKAAELQVKIESVTANYQPLGISAILSDLVAAYKLAVECEWSTRQPRTKAMFRVVEANLDGRDRERCGNPDRRISRSRDGRSRREHFFVGECVLSKVTGDHDQGHLANETGRLGS